ncbi:SAM-dependent methyltransferase [Pannus brasiliensis CCIBt3594]|uniref:SAM-dependent methyltransferase n=1 Tax=Pannus brasiliensis CCIBt3594 TaxID=1427578 RepID=A0AAW9QDZ5_9CHRO
MAMELSGVVPFGRSFEEYVRMFQLSERDLQGKIIGVGDGPASFNATATEKGFSVISIDPIYTFSGAEIRERFDAVVDDIIEQVKATPNDWVWSYHTSPEHLRENRVRALETFLEDYERGKESGRYRVGELPKLGLAEDSFDLALCSHFLFLYSDHYDYDFHLDSIREMLRVSPEVRIFPLLTLRLQRSPYLDRVVQDCRTMGYRVSIAPSDYEFQKGGNEMLRISRG